MSCQKDVKNFLFSYTPSQDLIWAKFENISPNPCEGGTFHDYLSLFFGGKVWWELCTKEFAISVNHGERIEIANKCSSSNWSSTIPSSPACKFILNRRFAITFSLPRLSTIVRSNYCNKSNYLIILAFTSGLFIKYLISVWLICTNVWYPVM